MVSDERLVTLTRWIMTQTLKGPRCVCDPSKLELSDVQGPAFALEKKTE